MNYYKRHLGDYAKDTRHLSMLEHGAFGILLDHYYATEKSIPDELCERIANAHTNAERKAVRFILETFFTKLNGSWINEKCEAVIAESFSKSNKAAESAKARWTSKEAMRTHSERNAKAMLATTPLASKEQEQEISTPEGVEPLADGEKLPAVPFVKIVDLYHEKLPQCRRLEKLTDARKGHIRQRWREDLPTLDAWGNYFDDVARSPFLTGRVQGRDGRPPFVADLGWLCKPSSFASVAEGKYHR